MKTITAAITTILLAGLIAPLAYAESVPSWIKSNAGWWADGTISESDFVQGIQYLIKENILKVPPTTVSEQTSEGVPDWVKSNAGWWAEGIISDSEFVNGIQYLISVGVISVQSTTMEKEQPKQMDSELATFEAELENCQDIKKAYERLNCERAVKLEITVLEYKANSDIITVGPVLFYNPGVDFETSASGQDILSFTMLAENTSNENITMMCTGPAICNYDVWNGDKAYKYSGNDFTNGAIVLKPGELKEFSMLFGPNIGYGGTEFDYDSSKNYVFRISEPWGSGEIPLDIS